MKISGTFGGKLEINVETKAKVKKDVDVKFEAGVKADCYFKITANPNFDRNNRVDWTTEFSGLVVTVYYNIGIVRRNSNNKPKELDPIKLIPSFKNSTSMTFGKD